jgi:nanoRNase/pAp phosphatase (c-di-AMP/oligoRNAs hydrolase)
MYAEYLEQGLLQLDPAREDHTMLATALMHGLITDTNGFLRAGPEDFRAAAFLSRFRDPDILERIMGQEKSKKTMEIIKQALENRILAEGFSVAGIGYLRGDDRDAVPQAADFLLTEENVHTAIVFGIVQGPEHEEAVVGSLRTSKLALDPDEFLKGALGRDASGAAYGGGKHAAGGFQIPVDFLAGSQDEEFMDLKWRTYEARIKQCLFDKIGYHEPAQDSG